jgi:hypothetical protein
LHQHAVRVSSIGRASRLPTGGHGATSAGASIPRP